MGGGRGFNIRLTDKFGWGFEWGFEWGFGFVVQAARSVRRSSLIVFAINLDNLKAI